jgi:hypothetical protein
MQAFDLLERIYSLLNTTFPTDASYTIDSVEGSLVRTTVPIVGGDNNGWRFGVCNFTDGAAKDRFRVVMDSGADFVDFGSGQLTGKLLAPGDTFDLTGAPLTDAAKYQIDPPTLSENEEAAVILHLMEISEMPRVLGSKLGGTFYQVCGVAAEASVPHRLFTGSGTQRVAWANLNRLMEQTRAVLRSLRKDGNLNPYGESPIMTRWVMVNRTPPRVGFISAAKFKTQK